MKTKPLYFSGKNFNRLYICLSALALLLGGTIYVLFRPSESAFLNWMPAITGDWLDTARLEFLSLKLNLPEWIVFSLPNGLWAFAYALLITGIWSGNKSILSYIWMTSIPLLVLGHEVLQYSGIIPGTFCFQDMTLGVTGLIIGIIAGMKLTKPYNHEQAFE